VLVGGVVTSVTLTVGKRGERMSEEVRCTLRVIDSCGGELV
jgi:hypothetical protein